MVPVSKQNDNEFSFKTSRQLTPEYFIIRRQYKSWSWLLLEHQSPKDTMPRKRYWSLPSKKNDEQNYGLWCYDGPWMKQLMGPRTSSSRTCIPRTQALTSRPSGEARPVAPHLTQVKDQYNKNSASYNSYICLYKMEK